MARHKSSRQGRGRWHTVALRNGEVVVCAPDGRRYHGTVAEVRDAAMAPWRRSMLAEGLRIMRQVYAEPGTAERAWVVAERRREAIRESSFDDYLGTDHAEYPAALGIQARAAARLVGMNYYDFVADAVRAMVEAARDQTADGQLPLTRHERAALARICAGKREGARHG